MKLFSRTAERWLARPRIYFLVLLVAILLASGSVFTGFSADDYFLRVIILQDHFFPLLSTSPLDAFTFLPNDNQGIQRWIEGGILPWWTNPKIRLAFWRPLSVLTHWFDFKLYPATPWLMHVHNLVWYGMLCMMVLFLYQLFFLSYWHAPLPAERVLRVAGIAALVYAADDAHGLGVGWISNRNAIIAVFFAVIALLLHDRWRQRHRFEHAILSPVCLGMGLLAGESALAICGYLFAYALFIDRGRLLKRLLSLVPCAVVVALWLIIYKRLGYGAVGTGLYLDPVQNPAFFLAELVQRLPVLLLGQLGMPNSALWTIVPNFWSAFIYMWALFFLSFCCWMLWPMLRRDNLASFFGLGMVLAAIPSCATYPNDRLLFLPGIGGTGLVVQYLAIFWNSGTNRMNKCSERPASTVKLLAIIWVAIHMVAGPLELPAASMTSLFFQRPIDWGAASMPADNQGRVVIVNLPIDMLQPYMFLTNASRRAALPTASWLLSAGVTAVEIESVDAHTVVVRPAAGLFNEPWDRAFRDTSLPFTPGDTLQLNGMTALVTKISPDGRPTEIRYRFEKPLADPQLQWVIWTRRGFRRFKPPEPGERKLLENPSLLWWM